MGTVFILQEFKDKPFIEKPLPENLSGGWIYWNSNDSDKPAILTADILVDEGKEKLFLKRTLEGQKGESIQLLTKKAKESMIQVHLENAEALKNFYLEISGYTL